MKKFLAVLLLFGLVVPASHAQKKKSFHLDNVLVIAIQNDIADRYSLEASLLRLFSQYHINTKSSLNVIKRGGSPDVLLEDSIQNQLKKNGIDTYLLVSVRGYDKRFKPPEKQKSLKENLEAGHLFPLYREGASKVTFTFSFYRNSKPIHYELIRTGSAGSKEEVITKLMKEVKKRLEKDWRQ